MIGLPGQCSEGSLSAARKVEAQTKVQQENRRYDRHLAQKDEQTTREEEASGHTLAMRKAERPARRSMASGEHSDSTKKAQPTLAISCVSPLARTPPPSARRSTIVLLGFAL